MTLQAGCVRVRVRVRVLHLGEEEIPPSPVVPCLASLRLGINKFTFDGPFHLLRLGKVLLNVNLFSFERGDLLNERMVPLELINASDFSAANDLFLVSSLALSVA